MNIKPAIYENLTAHERVIATVEAEARADTAERERLVESCPQKTYRINDDAYVGKMEALQTMAMAVELDMRNCLLNFFIGTHRISRLIKRGETGDTLYRNIDSTPECIEQMVSIRQAWHDFLHEHGINPATMDEFCHGLTHYTICHAVTMAEHQEVDPDPELVAEYKEAIEDYYFKKRAG